MDYTITKSYDVFVDTQFSQIFHVVLSVRLRSFPWRERGNRSNLLITCAIDFPEISTDFL